MAVNKYRYTGNENLEDDYFSDIVLGLGKLGLYGVATHAAINYANENDKIRRTIAKIPGAKRYINKHNLNKYQIIAKGGLPVDLSNIHMDQSVGRSMLSIVSSIEEMSPMNILKNLQLSNTLEPFIKDHAVDATKGIHINSSAVAANVSYYTHLLKYNGSTISTNALKNGFVLLNGSLYEASSTGEALLDKKVVNVARLSTGHVAMGARTSPNRVLNKFSNIIGNQTVNPSETPEQAIIIGAKNTRSLAFNWFRAYTRQAMEIGYKSLDNPLAGFEEILNGVGIGHLPFMQSNFYKRIRSLLNINFGTGGKYDLSTRQSLKLVSKNLAIKGASIWAAYQTTNLALNKFTSDDSIWHNGLLSGFAHLYGGARVGLAKIFADPFQGYKRAQEEAAPGSTDLSTLIGFPLAGAVAGASLSYYKRMFLSATTSIEHATAKATATINPKTFSGKILTKMGFKELTPYKANAIKGALVGAALALPFLPGALIGESSKELKDKYEGRTLVENRAGRWWLFGGTKYSGSNIKNYQFSMVYRLKENPDLYAKYHGDYGEKLKYDPILHPLKYLRDPYKHEKATKDTRPYPVWGMDVSYGGFLGKLYQGTVGEIIKPTILSPEFKRSLRYSNATMVPEDTKQSDFEKDKIRLELAQQYKGIPRIIKNSEGQYTILQAKKPRDRKLEEGGLMERTDDVAVDPLSQPLKKTAGILTDFIGLKGFIGGTLLNNVGVNYEKTQIQLERSGGAESAAKKVKDLNAGDMLGCFIPDTLVKCKDGYKEIQHLKVGDQVLSADQQYQEVKHVFEKYFTDIIVLTITCEDNIQFTTTPDHVFPTYNINGDYLELEIGSLQVGCNLLLATKRRAVKILKIETSLYSGKMYDINVAHTPYYSVYDVLCHNSGEFQRRLIPTSAAARQNTINPMKNKISPWWLPHDESEYYIDFGHGDYWNKVSNAAERLPGPAYSRLHPEVKGVDPNDYSLARRYSILADVAPGSPQLLITQRQLDKLDLAGQLDPKERELYYRSRLLLQKKRKSYQEFDEYLTPEQKSKLSLYGKFLNFVWEKASHNAATPLEALTPLRPADKFIHKRTAIEDYRATMIEGPDTGIWTNPYSHFIKLAYNRLASKVTFNNYKSSEAKERDTVDEYFDKLAYLKARHNKSLAQALKTTIGSTYAGLNDSKEFLKFRKGLSAPQRKYLDSFSRETDPKKRKEILDLLPKDLGMAYMKIWDTLYVAEDAKKHGKNTDKVIKEKFIKDTDRFEKLYHLKKRERAKNFEDAYKKAQEKRLEAADIEAKAYVEARTGIPKDTWIGWDKRLNINDLKIRTLTVGKADIFRYGFWNSDVERNDRITALDNERKVTNSFNAIRRHITSNVSKSEQIRAELSKNGILTKRITLTDASRNDVNLNLAGS